MWRAPYRERLNTSLWSRLLLSGRLGGVLNVAVGILLISAVLVPYLANRVGLLTLSSLGSAEKEEVSQPPDWRLAARLLDFRDPEDPGTNDATINFPFNRRVSRPGIDRAYHLLGTDSGGRDLLETSILAAHNAFVPGAYSVLLAVGLGSLFGILWGYYGGWRGSLVESIIKVVHAVPRLFLLLMVAGLTNFNVYWIMTGLGIINFPKIAELIRARILQLKRQEFITAAKEVGMEDLRILIRHILWYNCRHILFIQASFGMADAVLTETTLSYLGFGAHGEIPSWGQMVAVGKDYLFNGEIWMCAVPAAAILFVILGFCLVGDGLTRLFKLKVH